MIHFITMALGGDGYLNFMGNEVSILASAPDFCMGSCAVSCRYFFLKKRKKVLAHSTLINLLLK
jgi:hypothetical protein